MFLGETAQHTVELADGTLLRVLELNPQEGRARAGDDGGGASGEVVGSAERIGAQVLVDPADVVTLPD